MSVSRSPADTQRWLKLTAVVVVALCTFAFLSYLFNPVRMLNEWPWGYMHLVPTATKVRLINETHGDISISWPGGCGLVPRSDEQVMFTQYDPIAFEVVDSDGRKLPFRRINDWTFQYESADYPILVTFTVAEVRDFEARLSVKAEVLKSRGR